MRRAKLVRQITIVEEVGSGFRVTLSKVPERG